jgi:transcription elongation factor GreA
LLEPHGYRRRAKVQETAITREGYERLSAELALLTGDGRRRMAERLKNAAGAAANRTEDPEYLGAREDQELLERQIALLQERLLSAEVVDPQLGNGRVDIGERVRLRNLESGERLEVQLVGPLEADASAGRISVRSPLGRAILGRRRGHVADVDAPRGLLQFKILAVEAEPRSQRR